MNHNRMNVYLLGAASIAAILVIAKVPLAGMLPFGLVLGCGLMMFFVMKGMGGMGETRGTDDRRRRAQHDSVPKVDGTPEPEPVEQRF